MIDHKYCTSIVNIIRMDAWVCVFLLYVNRLGPGGHKGGKSVHRMMSDYESMMNLSLKQIQEEIKSSICAAIKEEGRDEKEFLEELRILEGDSIEEICRNEEREFTTAIPMFIGNERWIYIYMYQA